jgi:hypothetical protein
MTGLNRNDNGLIICSTAGVRIAYGCSRCLYMSPDVPYNEGVGASASSPLLTLSLVNFVKLRLMCPSEDRDTASVFRNERILSEYVGGDDPKD